MALHRTICRGVVAGILATVAGTTALAGLATLVGISLLGRVAWQTWVAAIGWQLTAQLAGVMSSGAIIVVILALLTQHAARRRPAQ